MNPRLHPRLKQLLQVDGRPAPDFLARLTEQEQGALAERIERRLEAESDGLYTAMAFVANLMPTALKVKVAETMLGPRATAQMTSYVTESQAIKVAQAMRLEFLAEVALHLQPARVTAIMERSPDAMLVGVARRLAQAGHYTLLAGFADHLSPAKLRTLAEKLGHPRDIVLIAYAMLDKGRMVRAAVQFSDAYLLELMQSIAASGYYDMAALVGQAMPLERQVRLLRRLAPSEAARLAAHYPPEIIAQLLPRVEQEQAVAIGLWLEGPVLGQLFNQLDASQLNQFLPYLNPDKLLTGLPAVNLKHLEIIWPALSPQTQQIIRKLARAYQPLADVLQ